MSKAPFITGSHAYGEPRPDSDIDLVVWAETGSDTRNVLEENGYPVRFGKLNLILVDDEEQWQIWKRGTDQLVFQRDVDGKPISRDEAVKHFVSGGVLQRDDYSDSILDLV